MNSLDELKQIIELDKEKLNRQNELLYCIEKSLEELSSKKIHLETEKENLISDQNLCNAEFKQIVNEIYTLLDE